MKDGLRSPASCPVCRARFRGLSQCSRCGDDLTAPMLLAAHAYILRQAAGQSLRQSDLLYLVWAFDNHQIHMAFSVLLP
jgi:hypothetical protein